MEMEKSLQVAMAHILAEIEAKAEARQQRADADAKACQEKMNAEMEARAEARQEGAEASQERADARQEKVNAEMKASQERASAEMKALQAEIKAAYAKMEARADARHVRFLASLDRLTSYGKGTTTYQTETTRPREMKDAIKMEINPEETETSVECQELLMEEVDVDAVGSSEDQYGDRRLVVRHWRDAKKRTQDSVGSRQKLSAARKRVMRHAVPAV
jgi:hypothetical protein